MSVLFDLLTALGVLVCAGVALIAQDRIASVAAFMIMGLLVALAWVRLGAPDVALAEAAIGAGLTGALFLRSLRRMTPAGEQGSPPKWMSWAAGGLGLVLAGAITVVLVTALAEPVYPTLVAGNLDQSGVTNPVTAVLLNFRAWDTLLEIAVLLVALLLVRLLLNRPLDPSPLGELVLPFARIIAPIAVLLAGHLLWRGASAPGGAFQAGAVLAGGGLALVMTGVVRIGQGAGRLLVLAGLAGLAVFLLAALATAAMTGGFLDYPAGEAKIWIMAIETALTLSIAATLVLLFVGPDRSAQ